MKVLIFSHKSDIDGMGSVVLAKLAFFKVDYVLCETFNLQVEISKYYANSAIYNYDLIFVTDMWVEEPLQTIIANDNKLKNKFFVFDHHESALQEKSTYDFITIKISNKEGLCSGTSLFYEYLISRNYLDRANKCIFDFSENTRKYDTWEWCTIYHEEEPHELSLLFDVIGAYNYLNLMTKKLKTSKIFKFTKSESLMIENKKNQVSLKLQDYSEKFIYKNILGLKAGIIFIDYEYRNDLAEYLRINNFDLDFVMLIALDYNTISYRRINPDVNVRIIAEHFGGKGHDAAASSPIKSELKETIINLFLNKEN